MGLETVVSHPTEKIKEVKTNRRLKALGMNLKDLKELFIVLKISDLVKRHKNSLFHIKVIRI
jgi:hypothetical protein